MKTSVLSKSINTSVHRQDLEAEGSGEEGVFHVHQQRPNSSTYPELLQVMDIFKNNHASETVVLENLQSLNMRLGYAEEDGSIISNMNGRLNGSLWESTGEIKPTQLGSTYRAHVSTSVASDSEYFEKSRWEKFYSEVSKTIPQEKLQHQLELEGLASVKAAKEYTDTWNEACQRGGAGMMGPFNDLIVSWHGPLTEAIKDMQKGISKSRANPGTNKACAEPFLCILDADELSYLTINAALTWTLLKHRRTLDQSASSLACSVRKAKIAEFLGRAVETEVGLKVMKEQIKSRIKNPDEEFKGVKESKASKEIGKRLRETESLSSTCRESSVSLTLTNRAEWTAS